MLKMKPLSTRMFFYSLFFNPSTGTLTWISPFALVRVRVGLDGYRVGKEGREKERKIKCGKGVCVRRRESLTLIFLPKIFLLSPNMQKMGWSIY
jgi:hypothetical protein